jgi:hypothetical protein
MYTIYYILYYILNYNWNSYILILVILKHAIIYHQMLMHSTGLQLLNEPHKAEGVKEQTQCNIH